MFIKKQFEGITVQVYEDKYKDALYNFKLNERQQIYSSLPSDVLEDALHDKDRIANIALNKKGEVVGFFVLHQYYQHEGYDTPKQVIYVRSLSVNQNFQGYGYGTKMMMYLPQYVQSLFPDFNHLYLVVDAENESAWNVYERAGFMHTATKEEGPLGKERLYYLDLDSNHVSSLKLKPNTEDVPFNIHIIDLFKDGNKVGFIAVEKHEQRMNISSVEVNKSKRHIGIAESALRQLSTYIRKYFDDVSLLTITLYGENNELKPLCINSNFVEIESADDFKVFEKHINY